jgi:hypothetical protein
MVIRMTTVPLSLDLFARAADDVERTQYQILGGLQRARQAFAQNRIYPHLGRLVQLHRALRAVIQHSDGLRSARGGQLQRIDLKNRELVYAWPDLESDEMGVVEDLIRWALPHLQAAIEEGSAVFEFVDEHVAVEEVGIVPPYVQEGYLMVPDDEANVLHVLRYTVSIFTETSEDGAAPGGGARYRTLKTVQCRRVTRSRTGPHPSDVKLGLMADYRDLPNPATYFFASEVPFPYADTLLPVVKRKLMRYLHTEGGLA